MTYIIVCSLLKAYTYYNKSATCQRSAGYSATERIFIMTNHASVGMGGWASGMIGGWMGGGIGFWTVIILVTAVVIYVVMKLFYKK